MSACSRRWPTASRRSRRPSRPSLQARSERAEQGLILTDTPETIASAARDESSLWAASLRGLPDWQDVFSPLAPERYALGLETVYEAYLVHYGVSRLFAPADEGERVLLGDYLYAHGLVRIAQAGGVEAVAVMAELIAECAALRAAGQEGDGEAWVEATRSLGGEAEAALVELSLARHLGHMSRPT